MEIRRWHCYLVINCALVIPLLSAKSFSLNEAIAAESKLQKSYTTPSISSETNTRFSLNKAFTPEPVHKPKKYKSSKYYSSPLALGRFPSFRTKRLSEIASELKSTRLSDLLRPLHKRKRQSRKREAYKNGKIDEKYFPLFKNLGLLFDNLLNESGESYELSKKKHKLRKDSNEKRGIVCSCARKSDSDGGESRSYKTAVISAKTPFSFSSGSAITSQKSVTAAATTDTPLGNFGSLRQDKDVSLLFPRDTPSSRRDDNGHSERSRPTFHRSTERNIARNPRNRKHLPRNREYEFSTEYDEEDTDSFTRDDAGRDESRRGRNREYSDYSYERNSVKEETSFPKTKKASRNLRGHVNEFPRENKLETRRNETESEEFIPKRVRGVRGPLSENKIGDIAESVQSEENNEESDLDVPLDNSSAKRLAVGRGEPAKENQEVRPRDEAVTIDDMSNLDLALRREPRYKVPSVSIIDGYSIARDKNGQNKLTEKTIRIHV